MALWGSLLRTARPAGVRMMAQGRAASSLVLVEHDGKAISNGTLRALTAASKVGGDVAVLTVGKGIEDVVAQAGKLAGVSRVLHAECDAAGMLAETVAPVVAASAQQFGFSHIFAAATSVGKNILPRVAAKLDVEIIADILTVEDENTFTRPVYAGNAVLKLKSNDPVKVVTVRTTSFDPAATEGGSASGAEAVEAPANSQSSFVGEELSKSDRPELTSADIVVSGGRALKSEEEFMSLMTALADKMGAAIGASRAAVDAGYAPNEWQVGQTGKIVAPQLYVAVGISGAIQHVAGMKDSKYVVVINKDPEAPFFQLADYGLEADLFKAVPEMIEKL